MSKEMYEKSLEIEAEEFVSKKQPIDFAKACSIVEDALRFKHEHILREGTFSPEALKEAESKGLGDTVKKITNKMGIKQCGGCKKRQATLNKLFPYKDKSIKET